MGWLVSDHFRKFKERYPQGWKYLCNYPFKVIVNITLIFVIVFVTGVSMPEVSPIITDPYTAWKSMGNGTADDGTSSKSGSTGLASSGYSRRDNNLGGKFNFDYTTVMTISSSERSYWRGETRNNYSGTGWTTPSSSEEDYIKVNLKEKLQMNDKSEAATKTLKQTVTMNNTRTYPVLFGAYTMTNVEEINGKDDTSSLLWNSSQGELHWKPASEGARYPRSYVITSEVPYIPDKELKTKTYNELYGKDIDEAYLQIPDTFPSRVVDLAKQVTASVDTPYEKISLLQSYLLSNYAYTNEPDLSQKVSKDFVDSFLFEVKQGYCDYYSTSMVMMARSLNIPARWVKGYAPGQDRDAINDWQIRQVQGRSTVLASIPCPTRMPILGQKFIMDLTAGYLWKQHQDLICLN
ncbi:transglutaminase-like domain-containing protein [Paenibacillus pini]|uniref:transglutaminase-like domain-containing protein n=1 Tax=Paenibacillus pini TaxID=669461 RepID=UPI000691E3FF|nr:transglutaminase-like domain-containing protein [Paenibacillus pini]